VAAAELQEPKHVRTRHEELTTNYRLVGADGDNDDDDDDDDAVKTVQIWTVIRNNSVKVAASHSDGLATDFRCHY